MRNLKKNMQVTLNINNLFTIIKNLCILVKKNMYSLII